MTEAESSPTPASGTEMPGSEPAPAAPPPGTESMPDVETTFEEIDVAEPLVGIIMGSASDKPKMQPAGNHLALNPFWLRPEKQTAGLK